MFDFCQAVIKYHLRLSCSVAQSMKCIYIFFRIHGQLDPITWVCQGKLFWQLINKVLFLDWLLNSLVTSLFNVHLQCSSYEVICICKRKVCFKIVFKFPMQFLKCWPFLRLCVPTLPHDVVELWWTVRWLRESIVLTQHLDYLSTCHA